MHPTVSTLGVIAIIFATVTVTASETERSIAKRDVDRLANNKEQNYSVFHEEMTANRIKWKSGSVFLAITDIPRGNNATTVIASAVESSSMVQWVEPKEQQQQQQQKKGSETLESRKPTKRYDSAKKLGGRSRSTMVNDVQGDESGTPDVSRIHDDPNHDPVARTSNTSDQSRSVDNSRTPHNDVTSYDVTSEDLPVATIRQNVALSEAKAAAAAAAATEAAPDSSGPGGLGQVERLFVETGKLKEASNFKLFTTWTPLSSAVDEEKIVEEEEEEDAASASPATISSSTEAIEWKELEDIRAISFRVPGAASSVEENIEKTEKRQGHPLAKGNLSEAKIDEAKMLGETRKDHSRSLNNLQLHTAGKSTKAFYEIKPSIKTEMEKKKADREEAPMPASTQRSPTARKELVLPSVNSASGKYGPYFEDGDQEINITARIGSNVLLDCKVGMLGDKQVTWVQHNKDFFHLLTVGTTQYSADQRISLKYRYPNNWRLQILYATPRDSGLYECQVSTYPIVAKKINVIITAPTLTITDDSGRTVAKERHLKAGSALKLRCEARDVLESENESVVWTRGDETLTEDVSENRTTEMTDGKEVLVLVSTLVVERASPRHAGNYSCVVPGKAKTTIAVHVLNGELPAAVHDGNGVSRAVLNLWLIHLTVSYVFSR